MSCPYSDRCSDKDVKCATCMYGKERSYYVEYHEYPADKDAFRGLRPWPVPPTDDTGDDLRFPMTAVNYGLETLEEVKPWWDLT